MSPSIIDSRVETILSLLRSIASHADATIDIREFASSAEFQLRDLALHLKREGVDPQTFTRRRGDRGYIGPK